MTWLRDRIADLQFYWLCVRYFGRAEGREEYRRHYGSEGQ